MESVLVSIINAIAVLGGAWLVYRSHNQLRADVRGDIAVVQGDVAMVKTDVHKVELATNSMKDELVATTARANMSEGKALGNVEGRQQAAEEKKA